MQMDLKIFCRKTGARLNFKIAIISLHIKADPKLIIAKIISRNKHFKVAQITTLTVGSLEEALRKVKFEF